jgi:ABC-type transport system involved in multi-copper enzyme maturation permease subunit
MTTSAVPLPDVPTLDVGSTPRLSFSRLTAVELRKAWDTRAGFWLLLSIVGVTLLINVIFVLAAHDGERTFPNFMAASGAPQGILLPVLGILLVTSEWGQRTNLTTFTLEPSRGRVIAAKVTAAVVLGALAALIALGIAALATLAFGDDNAFDGVGIDVLGKILLTQELGILLVTSEWGQRTNLTTFTLEPSRGRVIAAKVTAAVVLGALAALIALGIAALATLAFGDDGAFDGVGIDALGKILLTQELGILLGLAFGLILLNSAAAIVLNYLLPIVFSIIASVWGWLNQYQPWVDLNDAQTPLQNLDDLTGHQWAQLATATLIWVVAPFIAGLIRVSKAEVK